MADEDLTPWEPPLAGTDVEQLLGSLDRMRWTFRWKVDGLDSAALNTRIGASILTLGGLIKHLTQVEATKFTWAIDGSHPGEPWASLDLSSEDERNWPFTSAADDSPEELYANYDAAVARSRQKIADLLLDGDLDQTVHLGRVWGVEMTLRRMLHDLVEEYSRHTGHADLLREAVDGVVGEDPPEGWRPER
ncbi:DUF664 domain-containing protein [Tessaracoccus sp. ZS01]|uniref:mycothiol transferase n=1 Tax=Tessaracoccus sp. ZS01 TaxID=1906324 RepID=UPI00096DB277|nr:DUF664 domain-containing protein [Tessaracoccus sp. ZS01]MCG6568385.1 DUF664 domain-containing protein [Tessaracoccus sp. ZS01]OMG52791.1 mini-circle protein [Tessaracoccus sp. ZS01]